MKYWAIYGYDMDWKEPIHYPKIYKSEDEAKEKLKELSNDKSYKYIIWCIEKVEVEE